MKQLLVFAIIINVFFSCDSDDGLDCSLVLCAGAPSLIVEIFDQESGEQYFTEVDSQAPEGLIITRDNGTVLEFGQGYFFLEGAITIFQAPETATISLEGEFEIVVTAEVNEIDTSGCCPDYSIGNVTVDNGAIEVIAQEPLLFRITI